MNPSHRQLISWKCSQLFKKRCLTQLYKQHWLYVWSIHANSTVSCLCPALESTHIFRIVIQIKPNQFSSCLLLWLDLSLLYRQLIHILWLMQKRYLSRIWYVNSGFIKGLAWVRIASTTRLRVNPCKCKMKLQRLQHKCYDPSIVSTCLNTEFPAPTFMHLGALYTQSMKDVKSTLTL